MSKSPDPVTLRSVLNDDQQHFRAWYENDRKGLEQFFGMELPTEEEYVIQLNRLFGQMQQYTARMLMAEIRDEPIGIMLVSELGPERHRAELSARAVVSERVGCCTKDGTPGRARAVAEPARRGGAPDERTGVPHRVVQQPVR